MIQITETVLQLQLPGLNLLYGFPCKHQRFVVLKELGFLLFCPPHQNRYPTPNLMWPLLGKEGTYVNQGLAMVLDQLMVGKGISKANQEFRIAPDSIGTIRFPDMTKCRYQTPIRFGLPSKPSTFNPNEFSDHLPVQLILKEY